MKSHAQGNAGREVVDIDFGNSPGGLCVQGTVDLAFNASKTERNRRASLGDFKGEAIVGAGGRTGDSAGLHSATGFALDYNDAQHALDRRIDARFEDAGGGKLKIGVDRFDGTGNDDIPLDAEVEFRRGVSAEAHYGHLAGTESDRVSAELRRKPGIAEYHASESWRLVARKCR